METGIGTKLVDTSKKNPGINVWLCNVNVEHVKQIIVVGERDRPKNAVVGYRDGYRIDSTLPDPPVSEESEIALALRTVKLPEGM